MNCPYYELRITSFLNNLFGHLNKITLLRRKPRLRAVTHYGAQAWVFRPWMNVRRVPFEAPKERSRVCFGGFRPTKYVEEPWALARGAPLSFVPAKPQSLRNS